MGLRGPKPKDRQATPRQRQASVIDLDLIAPALPPPPDHLSPQAKAWWNDRMREFVFEPHRLQTLAIACECWDRKEAARKALAEHGLTFVDDHGRVSARPEVQIEKDATVRYLRALRELSLDEAKPPSEDNYNWRDTKAMYSSR